MAQTTSTAGDAAAPMLAPSALCDLLDALEGELVQAGGLALLWARELAKEHSEGDHRGDRR